MNFSDYLNAFISTAYVPPNQSVSGNAPASAASSIPTSLTAGTPPTDLNNLTAFPNPNQVSYFSSPSATGRGVPGANIPSNMGGNVSAGGNSGLGGGRAPNVQQNFAPVAAAILNNPSVNATAAGGAPLAAAAANNSLLSPNITPQAAAGLGTALMNQQTQNMDQQLQNLYAHSQPLPSGNVVNSQQVLNSLMQQPQLKGLLQQ